MPNVRFGTELDSRGYQKGLGKLDQSTKGYESRLKSVGKTFAAAFSVGVLTRFARSITELGSTISDVALQTGLSTDELQAFEAIAIDAGAGIENIRKALISLRDTRSAALNGEKTYQKAIEGLGLSLNEVARMTDGRYTEAIARAFKETQNFSALVDLVGKRNAGALEEALLRLANGGFEPLIESLMKTGRIWDQEFITKLDRAEDAILRLQETVKKATGGMAADIGESAGLITNLFQGFFKEAKEGGFINIFNPADLARGVKSAVMLAKEAENIEKNNAQRSREEEDRRKRIRQIKEAERFEDAQHAADVEEMAKESLRLLGKKPAGDDKQKNPFESLMESLLGFDPRSGVTPGQIPTDELRRVGGFTGAHPDPQFRKIDIMIQVMKNVEKHTADISAKAASITIAGP